MHNRRVHPRIPVVQKNQAGDLERLVGQRGLIFWEQACLDLAAAILSNPANQNVLTPEYVAGRAIDYADALCRNMKAAKLARANQRNQNQSHSKV
jgi:hypothetical protein